MTDTAGQIALKGAASAVGGLLLLFVLIAGAFVLRSALAGVAPPAPQPTPLAAESERHPGAIPKLEAAPEERPCATPAPEKALIRELMAWIGEHTDYDTARATRDPPSIEFSEAGKSIRYEGEDVIVDSQLRAAYELRRRRIFLVLPWSASETRDVATLLHELLHDIQFSNRRWTCKGEAEWEAYKLQEVWLAERGLASGFDWPQIFLMSRCPRDVHP